MTTLGAVDDAGDRSIVRVKRRPKDRKEQINRVAAEMFSAQGYNATSMEAIAAKVDISAPALYRHYASKYDMFAAVLGALGQELVRHTDFVDEVSDAEVAANPEAVLNRVIHAVIDAALLTRSSGGLYRWERRYLRPEDQTELMKGLRLVNKRIQRGLLKVRPGLSMQERWMLSVGLLSVIGSINEHRITVDDDVVHQVLSEAATALLGVEFPEPGACEPVRLSVWRIFTPDAGAGPAAGARGGVAGVGSGPYAP